MLTGDDRLEAATSRLEDIASSVDGAPSGSLGAAAVRDPHITAAATESSATVTPVLEALPAEPLPKSIEDFDKIIEEEVAAFVEASTKIGGLVEEQVGVSKHQVTTF